MRKNIFIPNNDKSSRTNLLRSKGILVPAKHSKKGGVLAWSSGKHGTYVEGIHGELLIETNKTK